MIVIIIIYLKRCKLSRGQLCKIVHGKKCRSTTNVTKLGKKCQKQQQPFAFFFRVKLYEAFNTMPFTCFAVINGLLVLHFSVTKVHTISCSAGYNFRNTWWLHHLAPNLRPWNSPLTQYCISINTMMIVHPSYFICWPEATAPLTHDCITVIGLVMIPPPCPPYLQPCTTPRHSTATAFQYTPWSV